jgi:hypothetical protein
MKQMGTNIQNYIKTIRNGEGRPFFETSSSLLFEFEKRFRERMGYIESKYG